MAAFTEDRLAEFLSAVSAAGNAPPNSIPFVVNTSTSGLAVHYAPMFLLGRMTYFNAPTTPVNGFLSPGLWKFGGVGAGRGMVVDPGVFDAKLGQATLTAI